MKKIFALALALLLFIAIPCEAFAEMPDFSAMTEDELLELINHARNELTARSLKAEENTVLYDQDGIQIYLTGKKSFNAYEDTSYLYLEAVIINDSERNIGVSVDSASINGWEVTGWGISDVSASKKKRDNFEFYTSDADVFDIGEIEELEVTLHIYDCDSYETFKKIDPIIITLDQ